MLQNTVKDLGNPSLNFSYAKVNFGQQDQGSQVHPPNNLSPERDGTLDPMPLDFNLDMVTGLWFSLVLIFALYLDFEGAKNIHIF